jgi:hypothetical protein
VFPQEGLLNQPQGGVDLVALAAKHIRRTFVAGGVDTTLGTLRPVGSPAEVRQLLGHVDPGQDSAVEMVVVTDAARGLALGLATACSPPRDDGLAGYAVCVAGSVLEVVGASDVATLHGAVAMLEMLYGVRHGLDGAQIPTRRRALALVRHPGPHPGCASRRETLECHTGCTWEGTQMILTPGRVRAWSGSVWFIAPPPSLLTAAGPGVTRVPPQR